MDQRCRVVLILAICSLCLLGVVGQQLRQGDECELDGGMKGTCRRVVECPAARQVASGGRRPRACDSEQNGAIVCCPTPSSQHPPTTSQRTSRRTTQRTAQISTAAPWYWKTTQRPIAPAPQPKRNGRSWQKCKEYAKTVFRKVYDPVLLFEPDSVLVDDCGISDHQLPADGALGRAKEFPHMAALGYGKQPNVEWLCGGSLISENFVLTAASCISSKDGVRVTWVRLGDLNPTDKGDASPPQTKRVAKVIPHPRYKPTSFYHDIALIKLRGVAKFDASVRPACLNAIPSTPVGSTAVTSGWGAPSRPGGRPSQDLMKFRLQIRSPARCNSTYKFLISARRQLAEGFAEESMLCVGDPRNARDTCVGFSGDPLQRALTEPYCMHSVLGVSSFGPQKCGGHDVPAVYTKVAHYIPWIESIVWP